MMKAQDLRLTFNKGTPIENPALQGVSLNIADGEFVTRSEERRVGKEC